MGSTTTTDLEDEKPRPTDGPTHPTLVLAFGEAGRRLPERCRVPDGGVLLGRDTRLFATDLNDDSISRRHAEIRPHHGRFRLHDLGSRNGSWVNGKRVSEVHALEPGDVIRVGATLLVYTRSGDQSIEGPSAAPKLVGESDAIALVRRSIGLVAGQRRSVLVTGETGTGKELVAEALHKKSARTGRFVAVNCGVLSKDMLASELFGHVRGAFTGAVGDRPGLFRAAHGGTLFLDELGELPLDLQTKLLRVLETGLVRPVGGTEEIPIDVAIVAATNRDLVVEVREQRFRADFYGRLVQWSIALPPLRKRRDDIPSLVRHLLGRCDAAHRFLSLGLTEALLLHPWPLNVRGLLNVLAVAALASPPHAALDIYPEVSAALEAASVMANDPGSPTGQQGGPLEKPAGIPAADVLEQALVAAGGSISAAARELGCTRQQLYRWLEHRGVSIERWRAEHDK